MFVEKLVNENKTQKGLPRLRNAYLPINIGLLPFLLDGRWNTIGLRVGKEQKSLLGDCNTRAESKGRAVLCQERTLGSCLLSSTSRLTDEV